MKYKYYSQLKFGASSPRLSKLRQKLGLFIQNKSASMKVIFSNFTLVKGGVYIHKRKCGKPACKCATTSYRHPSHYLYKSVKGKNIVTYLKNEEVGKLKTLTRNYIKFRLARAQLIKNEKEVMNVINQIEKERTVPFKREGKNEATKQKRRRKNKKK